MEPQLPKKRKKQTAQEAFKNLREKTKIEMHEKMQKIKDAQDRAAAEKAIKDKKKKDKHGETESSKKKEPETIKEKPTTPAKEKKVHLEMSENQLPSIETSHNKLPVTKLEHAGDNHQIKTEPEKNDHRYRKRQGRCTNCCGGLPGQGPGNFRGEPREQSCCNPTNRLRGGSDAMRSSRGDPSDNFEARSSSVPSGRLELPRPSRNIQEVGYFSSESAEFEEDSTVDSLPAYSVERSRGGCGGCGGSPPPTTGHFHCSQNDQSQRDSGKINHRSCPPPPCCQPCPPVPPCQRQPNPCAENSSSSIKGCCPCGGCGGPVCSSNPGGGEAEISGCCGGSRPRGRPCKCKCQSCSSCPPTGGCGGQSCGKIYSCAGSGGGRCCFPRNCKKRSDADCCGGADSNCGGCS